MEKEIGIPVDWRAPIAWLSFFTIIGIIIQSIQANSFVFFDFFWKNYGIWFRGLGSFVSRSAYSSPDAFLNSIFSGWYYFFYSGGVISLIWEFIVSIMNFEVKLKKKEKPVNKATQIRQ